MMDDITANIITISKSLTFASLTPTLPSMVDGLSQYIIQKQLDDIFYTVYGPLYKSPLYNPLRFNNDSDEDDVTFEEFCDGE